MSGEYQVEFIAEDPRDSVSATVNGLVDGVGIARYFLVAVKESDHISFSIVVESGETQPSLNLERIPDGRVLLQVFVPKAVSPEGEDGWYNLMEPQDHDSFSLERDVSSIYKSENQPGMVETRLSEGVLFARKMYAPAGMALEAVNHLMESNDLATALTHDPWKYVGLI